jgi:ATP-binding cassette subfamily C (CFTR/MRP) protein 1
MALVYQQSLQIREAEQGKVTAMAILGADVPQIVASLTLFHEVWASLLDVAIATWLLERNLSLACLAPVVLILSMWTEIVKSMSEC